MRKWYQATLILPFSLWFAAADHENGYHWARTSNPFTIQVIKSIVDTDINVWNDEFDVALDVWSQSEVIDLLVVFEETAINVRQECPYVSGKIRVCNADYGETGWLGIATYRAYVYSEDEKLTNAAKVRLNDYYEMDDNQRKHVACHELGHVFGLGHTSEDGSSQGTCMDYSNSPDSVRPNNNDYDELLQVYQHLDSQSTIDQNLPPGAPTPVAAPSVSMPTPNPVVAPSPSPVTGAPTNLRPGNNGGGNRPNNGGGGNRPNNNSTCISRAAANCEDEGELNGGNTTGHGGGNGNKGTNTPPGNSGNRGPPPHARKFGLPEQASAVSHDRFSATYELKGEKDDDGLEFVEHFNVLYAAPISQEEWEAAAVLFLNDTTSGSTQAPPAQQEEEDSSGSSDKTLFGSAMTVAMALSASFLL